jgi:tRNA-2-methylthio-N6-dimethylallyladenosine synthase
VIAPPRSFSVRSFGCQMNVYDGERMAEALSAAGLTADEAAPDLVVLNTCHIREKATEKVYSEIGRLKKAGVKHVAVAGCVAQAEGEEVLRRAPVDMVVGPQAYHRLPEMVARLGDRPVDLDMPAVPKFAELPARPRIRPGSGSVSAPSAFLTVMEGCDKFCTYCVVPYTRGSEVSRPFADVLDEARQLVDSGAKEITLLGQNVNAWTGEDSGGAIGLDGLIRALDRLPGLKRIRYTTSHPNDMSDGLIRAHAEVEKLMPYLHLPVQAGSDRVLHAMNRRHTRDGYLRLLDRVRAVRPDIALSGDFIVGFPGETEAEFAETLSIVDEVRYAHAFSFKYSPRPGTPAASMDGQIAAPVADERLQRLQDRLNRWQTAFNAATLGRRCEVLLERPGKRPGQLVGKTPWLQSAHLTTDARIGDLVTVDIVQAGPNSVGAAAVGGALAA